PAELEEMCLRALARRKEDRPASAKALADDVLTYLEGAREKARRRREAEAALGAGREIARRYFAVKEVLARYAEIHAGIASRFHGHEPVSEKKELWALEDQIEQMRVQRNRRFADAVRKLGSVLEIEAENRAARRELAELYWDRFLESEGRNDRADMDYALATVKFYNDGSLDERIRGDGSLAVETDPPGAEAYLYEYAERDRILVPEWGRPLGRTPVARFSLPMGSYLLHLRLPGKRDTRAPILVTRQEAVTARVRLFSEAEIGEGFVHVPAGPFIFGGDSQATSHRPKAVARVDDYFIGKFPVTMGAYLEYLNAIAPNEAARRVPRSVGIGDLARHQAGGRWRVPREGEGAPFPIVEDLPALGVSWEDATAYAAWRSARDGRRYDLPAEEQWEKAARGVDGRFYPWGDKFDATYCKCSRSRPGEPAAEKVGAYPEDESPYGVRDMAGGVREWCATRAASKADVRHLRGGSWLHSSTAARCASRAGDMANAALYIYGFRLATTEPAKAS
ncbi:MAG: SUMF1/EgtB/PvdO family nonheme iron enzyme, partial [Planctomycetales bacterium]|nr:SUMF1/EgtB/PvdO family nonheme iron enzyme [Planctomycetales bacterium]